MLFRSWLAVGIVVIIQYLFPGVIVGQKRLKEMAVVVITMREINRSNYLECLRLTVAPEQRDFVSTNAFSLAQSRHYPETVARPLYDPDTMVGFVMYCIAANDDNYWVWRLMVDEKHQGKGYARQAMQLVIAEITRDNTRNKILISLHPANMRAERLYESRGFPHGKNYRG